MNCKFPPPTGGPRLCPRCLRPGHPTKPTYRRCTAEGEPLTATVACLERRGQCVHLGDEAGLRDCNTCKGTVRQKVYRCLGGHGEVTLANCRTCPDYKPFRASRIVRVGLPEGSFNASIFQHAGKLGICWRQGWTGSNLWITQLDDGYQPVSSPPTKLNLRHPLCRAGREDPRVFHLRDRLHVAFSGVQLKKGQTIVHQMVARLDQTGTRVEEVWAPQYPERAYWEKNWAALDHEGELHYVYSISPHRVLKGERILQLAAPEIEWQPRWSGGYLRGGASPVRVGDEYWNFFHGALDQPARDPYRTYSLGLYCFEASPPFRPLRYVREPLMWPPEESRPKGLGISVVFPCGAIRRGDKWLVSYGLHDAYVEVAEFDHRGLQRLLVKV